MKKIVSILGPILAIVLVVGGVWSAENLLGYKNFAGTDLFYVNDSGNLYNSGTTTTGGTLNVTGVATLSSAVITGSATVGTTLGVTGILTAATNLAVTSNATIGGTLGVAGVSTLASAVITGAATVGTTLGVTGVLTAASNLGVTSNATVGGTLVVTGATGLSSLTTSSTIASTGAITMTASQTDGYAWFGPEMASSNGGTWNYIRGAEANWYFRKSAADETVYLFIPLGNLMQRTTSGKGVKITSINYVYNITTKAMDAHTCTLDSVTYASGSAPTVAAFGGSLTYTNGALATGATTNPFLTTITLGTPIALTTADRNIVLEITVNASDTTVFDYYGIGVNYTYNPL